MIILVNTSATLSALPQIMLQSHHPTNISKAVSKWKLRCQNRLSDAALDQFCAQFFRTDQEAKAVAATECVNDCVGFTVAQGYASLVYKNI